MAYGKGQNTDRLKRVVDLGRLPPTPSLSSLRITCLDVLDRMAQATWPADVMDPVPDGKEMDAVLLRVQSGCKGTLNSVWAEKMRLTAKDAVTEQWRRAQKKLFGKFRNVGSWDDPAWRREGDEPYLVNLPKEWTAKLSTDDVAALQARADASDFRKTLDLFRSLRTSDAGLPSVQADALRAMADVIRLRYGRPAWKRDEAVLQLHVDYRCVHGGRDALAETVGALDAAMTARMQAVGTLRLAAMLARDQPTTVPFRLSRGEADGVPRRKDERLTSLLVELGPSSCQAKGVVTRDVVAPPVAGHRYALGGDFGYRNTMTLVLVRSPTPIGQEAVDRIAGHNGDKDVPKVTKEAAREYLSTHVEPEDVEVVETMQFDGKDFLDRIACHATRVDRLRSEIDRNYDRLDRIRKEMNREAGNEPGDLVPEDVPARVTPRYMDMHGRFFRLLGGIAKLKELRRAVYRSVAGVKTSWFGFVTTKVADLAERYRAVFVREDLTLVTHETDDPKYKGRTFNKMINNGSKGQYIRRSDDKLAWRGIASIKAPSFYTSTTDTTVARVDTAQRKGPVFVAADGTRSCADRHAGETLAKYLFLVPKTQTTMLAAE